MTDILNTSLALDPRELACSDRVLAVLREAEEPLTTLEVCQLAGPRLTAWRHRYPFHQPATGRRVWALVECHAEVGVDVVAELLEVDRWGLLFLMRLERFGFVRRMLDEERRQPVWWSVAPRREWDGEIEALDELITGASSS